jgi:F0F1-type ATP synthase assembly protein I
VDLIPHQRDLHRGFGNALARAFEFAGTLGVFVVVGYLLDRWLGTEPWITLAAALFCVVGQFVKLWAAYTAEMQRHESEFWERRR